MLIHLKWDYWSNKNSRHFFTNTSHCRILTRDQQNMRLLDLKKMLWPRKLSKQLILVNALMYSITFIGFASYSAQQQNIDKSKANAWQMHQVAEDIAELSSSFLLNNKILALKNHLLSLRFTANIESITIRAAASNQLITLNRKSKSKFEANIIGSNSELAAVEGSNTKNPTLQVRKAIFIDHNNNNVPVGWVEVNYNPHSINAARTKMLKNSLAIALLAILFSLLILRLLLLRPMRALKKAADFAEWLDLAQGGQVEVDHSSQEIELLGLSLNRTAKKIHLHEESQNTANTLIDAIREIQTQYISDVHSPRLYTNLLSKIVHLTGSEIGFIGELMHSDDNKPYLKIYAISNTKPGGKYEQFMNKHAPDNMEFHNIQNLFGTVLQTKKPTIANDPLNDPRRGGLPDGHPVLKSFLGLPIFYAGELVGMAGVANKIKDYDQGVVAYVQPLLSTIGHIINSAKIEQKKASAQEELRESTMRFASILSSVADGVMTFDSNGVVDTINPAVVKIFGYQNDEAVGKDINYFIPGLYNQNLEKLSNLSMLENSDSADASWNTLGRRKDSSIFPVEINVNNYVLSGIKKYTLTLRDNTKRVKHEEQLQHSAENFEEGQHIAHLGTWEYIPKTKTMNCSAETLEIFHLDANLREDVYQTITERVHPEDRTIITRALTSINKAQESFSTEFRILIEENLELYISCKGTIHFNENSAEYYVVGTVQDITTQKMATVAKDEIMTTMLNEFRGPLTTIRASLNLVKKKTNLKVPKYAISNIDNAFNNACKLSLLINNFTEFEHIETGRFKINTGLMDLVNILQKAIHASRSLAEAGGIKFNFEPHAENIWLDADAERLIQVISNILSRLVTSTKSGAEIGIFILRFETMARIEIASHGGHIPQTPPKKAMEKFSPIERRSQNRVTGEDIELTISRTIIEKHGGTLSIESTQAGGIRYYIDLPVPVEKSAASNL